MQLIGLPFCTSEHGLWAEIFILRGYFRLPNTKPWVLRDICKDIKFIIHISRTCKQDRVHHVFIIKLQGVHDTDSLIIIINLSVLESQKFAPFLTNDLLPDMLHMLEHIVVKSEVHRRRWES